MQYETFNQDYITFDRYCDIDPSMKFLQSKAFKGNVVDIGSGYGEYFPLYRKDWDTFTGIEPNDYFRQQGKEEAEKLGFKNASFLKAYAQDLPLPDKFADVFICSYSFCVFETAANANKAFEELKRVAKPGADIYYLDLSGGQNDDYSTFLYAVEALSGEKPVSDITDIWREAFLFFSENCLIEEVRTERLRYTFPDEKTALEMLSQISPSLMKDNIKEKVAEIFKPVTIFKPEATLVHAVLR